MTELRDLETDDGDGERTVSAHQCTPERVVFTEEANPDGWIATDLTIEPTE